MSRAKSNSTLSRLTDPSKYTGAHKSRFDAEGRGKGLAGRDMGNEGRVNDLSSLTRANLRGSSVSAKTAPRSPTKTASPAPKKTESTAKRSAASPTSKSPSSKGGKADVLSRLTDTSKYTGAHKSRFDASGKGKGLAGRDMGNEAKVGDLSQLTRANLHKGSGDPLSERKRKTGTVSGVAPIHVQKFGTQAATAKKIKVYQNGDKNHSGVTVTLTKAVNTFAKLLTEATNKLTLGTGACQKLYRYNGPGSFHLVRALEEIEDGAIYLGCGPEPISHDKMPTPLSAPAAADAAPAS